MKNRCGRMGFLVFGMLAVGSVVLPSAQAQRDASDYRAPYQDHVQTETTTSSFFSGGFEFGGNAGDGPYVTSGDSGGSCELSGVLVVPLGESDPNRIRALREDLAIMAEILNGTILPLLTRTETLAAYGYGAGGHAGGVRCMYVEGFGAVFVVQVDFPLTWRPGYERTAQGSARRDLVWETARERVLGARQSRGNRPSKFAADRVVRLKQDIIASLAHAANLVGVQDGEWIVVAVQSVPEATGATGFSYFYRRYDLTSLNTSEERPNEPSVLSLRVKKGDTAAFAEGALSAQAFAGKVTEVVY